MKKLLSIVFLLGSLLAIGLYSFWYYGGFLPPWIIWGEKQGLHEGKTYQLKDGELTILKEGEVYYQSPPDHRIQDFFFTGLDREDGDEAVLVVWKHGSFGRHRPTWIERDDPAFSQHIFIYKPEKDRLRPIWMSSALDMEVFSLKPGKDRVLELTEPSGRKSLWGWLSWGLVRLD